MLRSKESRIVLTMLLSTLVRVGPALAAGVKADFNGDGFSDLAVGIRKEAVNGHTNAGAINIIYGSSTGLTATGSQFFSQDSPNCGGSIQTDDYFGASLAIGDFNNDGKTDLAVGAYGKDGGEGVVHVLYGAAGGLTCAGSHIWRQNDVSGGVAGANHWFGWAVDAGDFNKDGYADLAIGTPGDSVPGGGRAGSVTILYGSGTGLKAPGAQIWTLNSPGVAGTAADGDMFGDELVVGHFGKGGQADLAIGIEGKSGNSGAVAVLYGSATGLSANGSQYWTQASLGGTAESFDLFGAALAAGNFGKSGDDDLAIGAPGEDTHKGVVHILYGSSSGLTASGNQVWTGSAASTEFGAALVAADFGRTSYADLAVGAPYTSVSGFSGAGSVKVLYGSSSGLSSANSQSLSLGSKAGTFDYFGKALAAADFGKSNHADLAIGIPGRNVSALKMHAGFVSIRYGTSTGLGSSDQLWSQDTAGVAGTADAGDEFGGALMR